MDAEAQDMRREWLRMPSLDVVMSGVLVAGTLTALFVRMFTHQLRLAIDDWAYTVWGQAISQGHRPAVESLLTAPKPLAYALGTVVAPFRPGWGMLVAIAIFGAVFVVAIAIAVKQQVGFLGVPIALGFLAWTTGFRYNTETGSADLVTAALVVSALTVRGRWRVGLLVVAGLLRPDVWPVVALAAFLEAGGTTARRLAIGGLAGLIAPVVWWLTDVAANGRGFMFLVIARRDGTFSGSSKPNLHKALSNFYEALSGNIGLIAITLGVAGLIVQTVRGYRAGSLDPLPIATAGILAVSVAAELWQGLPPYPRYTTSVAALLLVGTGWLVGAILPRADGWPAGAIATGASVLMIGFAVLFHPVNYKYPGVPHLEAALPAVEQARVCGTISVAGQVHQRNPIMSTLSALGRMPLTTFSPIEDAAWHRSGVVLRAKPPASHAPLTSKTPWFVTAGSSWVWLPTSAGQLWLTAACVQKGGLLRDAKAISVVGA
ncbi:MAG: hypothetical protein QOG33_747 [Gaiellales bacterium]|nr:hypothetical protein [Gaiellales bacterium]